VNAGRAFALAWRVLVALPGGIGRGIFVAVALVAWLQRGRGVRQLECNLARLRPTASRRELRRLSRAGMRSYMRYYCESFQLPALTPEQLSARVRGIGVEAIRAELAAGRSVVLAVAHCGNWDLAGAWATGAIGRVVTVVERLEPEELFRAFLTFRESLGITIIPFEPGGGVFRGLIKHARADAAVIPLLADRDLSRRGIPVDLAGHPARVASGPAALATATGLPLYAARIWYERLSGARRRAAGSPWGIVVEFVGPLAVAPDVARERVVPELTQVWVDVLAESILAHPEDWHMLQKVFVEDLDPARLARIEQAGTR
jgi:KDO2-lipid IV(A) lauroyltransferase